jgi:hypothetical protein
VGIATEGPDMASAHRPADMRAAAESADTPATAKAAASAAAKRFPRANASRLRGDHWQTTI